jgi:sortase A
MKRLRQKKEPVVALPDPIGLLLAGALVLLSFIAGHPALAAPEQATSEATEQTPLFDLDTYVPDQSLWADKMKLKYEKAKDTDVPPLALLRIDRLNLKAPVYLGTDRITLDRGLGVVKGTAHPGEVGNIAISGHRDSFFRVLKDIEVGDRIKMQTQEGLENFEVSDISIVDALEVSVLDPTETTVLTLITCHPFYYQGYAPDRYIVRATPINKDPISNNNDAAPETIEMDTGGIIE